MVSFVFFGGFYKLKWPNKVKLTLLLVCPSILIVNVNGGQNKFIADVSKNVPKKPTFGLKQASCHFGAQPSIEHNSAISHPILTFFIACFFETNRMVAKNKALSLLVQILVFAPFFAQRPHMDNIAHIDLKPPAKCRNVSWPFHLTPSAKSCFSK